MHDIKWSGSEKKVARRAFEAALKAELAEVLIEFKSKAASAVTPDEMWSLEQYLNTARRGIDARYDYRYSQLLHVFGALVREGRVQESDLAGLSEEKLGRIRLIASLSGRWASVA